MLTTIALGLVACASPVDAQRALDVQTFAPPPGRTVALTIPDPELPPPWTLSFGLLSSYAREPLVRVVACDASATVVDSSCLGGAKRGRTDVVSDLGELDAALAVSVFDVARVGAVLPVGLGRVADDLAQPQRLRTRAGLGDLRLSALTPFARGDTALAFELSASLPTGSQELLLAGRGVSLMPRFVARQNIARVALSAALGYRARPRSYVVGLEQDDELDAALGAKLALNATLGARAELRARIGVGGRSLRANENPVELDLAATAQIASGLEAMLGGGGAVWPGRRGYGAPLFRLLAALRVEVESHACAFGAEDYDGFEDDDHCRDPDNDGDGIDDRADACPNDAEDFDGFEDGDGCPDFDDDADGIPDRVDRCPRKSEDRDGFQDEDGCPEPDNDGDGIPDARDACPMEPEDRDGYQDDDGCPEPGPAAATVTVSESRILVSERLYFDYDRDTLRAVSAPVIEQLAEAILSLPPGTKVVVEGHTDDTGNPDHNLDLSHRRARTVVEALRARGVPANQLDYRGFGAARPLAPNDTEEGRALNRRVEFVLVR